MNNDLISRDALQEEHSKECIHNCYYCQHFKWSKKKACSYCDVIDNAPTADIKPFAIVKFDKDELKRLVDERVIEPIKNGDLVLQIDERPHGEWIFDGVYHDSNNPIGSDMYHCSICERSIITTLTKPTVLFPFCHCGADMRGGAAND